MTDTSRGPRPVHVVSTGASYYQVEVIMRALGDAVSVVSLGVQTLACMALAGALSWPSVVLGWVAVITWQSYAGGYGTWTEAVQWTGATAAFAVPMVAFTVLSVMTLIGAVGHVVRLVLRASRPVSLRVPVVARAPVDARLVDRVRLLGERIAALRDLRSALVDAPAGDLDRLDRACGELEERRREARGVLARLRAADALSDCDIRDDLQDARARADAVFEVAGVRAA